MTRKASSPSPAKKFAAITLAPKEIKARFSIPPSTLHFYCEGLPEKDRLPSLKLPGKRGTNSKGKRLVYEHELVTWLEKWRRPAAPLPAAASPVFVPSSAPAGANTGKKPKAA